MLDDYYEEDEGIHFDPDDDELINHYLIPKSRGEACGDFIVMKNVYAKEPWLLDHNKKDRFFMENEWYYFVTRTQVSEKKIDCGKKAKRKIAGDNDGIDRGYWKANAKENITDEKTGEIIGVKQTLAFITSNQKKQKRGDGSCASAVPGSNSSWIMKEYMLPEGDKFQELVLCKIHEIKKSKNKDDHHEASTSTYHHHHGSLLASSSSEQQPINQASSSTQQPINIDREINKSKNEEASSSEQQRREASGLIAAGEGNIPMALERCENLGLEKDDQLHINAPLVCLGNETSLPIGSEEEEETDWFQYFGLRVEEGDDVVLTYNSHNTQWQGQNKDDHHESVLDSSSEQQPINEAHRLDPEIPRVGSEKNDQAMKTWCLNDDEVKERNREQSVLERCVNLGLEKHNQLHNNAPLVACLGSAQEAKEEEREFIQDLVHSLLTVKESGLTVEEDDEELLIHNTPWMDQDLRDQYASLCPTKTSQLS